MIGNIVKIRDTLFLVLEDNGKVTSLEIFLDPKRKNTMSNHPYWEFIELNPKLILPADYWS